MKKILIFESEAEVVRVPLTEIETASLVIYKKPAEPFLKHHILKNQYGDSDIDIYAYDVQTLLMECLKG